MRFTFLVIIFLLNFPALANAKRIALVIGNNDYTAVTKLVKAVNDSKAVADTLKDLGFEVIQFENLKSRGMNRAIYKEFLSKIQQNDEALFYYAGHGIEIRGRNYLLATDIPYAKPGNEHFVTKEAFAVDEILTSIEERSSRVSIMILDACRDNPFPKQGTRSLGTKRGLGRSEPPKGTFVMYSAGSRQAALDRLSEKDPHPNSVYTRKLLPLLKTKDLKITSMAKRLRSEVDALAKSVNHEQFPAYYDQLKGDFFFSSSDKKFTKMTIVNEKSEEALWKSIVSSTTKADFYFYLKQFPNGKYSAVAKLKIHQIETRQKTEKYKEKYQKSTEIDIANANIPKAVKDGEVCNSQEYNELKDLESIEAWGEYLKTCKKGSLSRLALAHQTKLMRQRAAKADAFNKETALRSELDKVKEQILNNNQKNVTRSYGNQQDSPFTPLQHYTSPSFNCSYAKLPVEIAICKNVNLINLDVKMAGLFGIVKGRQTKSGATRLVQIQRNWMKNRNNCGYNFSCIELAYKQQIFLLENY